MSNYQRVAGVVSAQQYRNADSWPDGVSREPDSGDPLVTSGRVAFIEIAGACVGVQEGDWVVRTADGSAFLVSAAAFARDYEEAR